MQFFHFLPNILWPVKLAFTGKPVKLFDWILSGQIRSIPITIQNRWFGPLWIFHCRWHSPPPPTSSPSSTPLPSTYGKKANAKNAFVPLRPTSKWHRFSFQLEQLQRGWREGGRGRVQGREGWEGEGRGRSQGVIWQRPDTRISRWEERERGGGRDRDWGGITIGAI